MYGQTNCWILPEGEYGCFEIADGGDILVMTAASARNLAYQGYTPTGKVGETRCLATVRGQDLLGCALKAPLSKYEKIYALPMLTVSMEKATGVVTSVPSDAPDDYAALNDLRNKPELRAKFGIKDEW